jgi:heme oxygenase
MSLREAIKPQHDAAEQHPFTVMLLAGKLPVETYANYLYNHLSIYATIENRIKKLGTFDQYPEVFRANKIAEDLEELDTSVFHIYESTHRCTERINSVSDKDLMAYFYLYHMADMYGGQMIKKVIPGSGRRFDFEDKAALVAAIRSKLTDDLADEAKVAFSFALDLFDELVDEYSI